MLLLSMLWPKMSTDSHSASVFTCQSQMQQLSPWSYKYYRRTRCCVYFGLSLAPKFLLVISMETGKAPHVSKGTRVKIWFFFRGTKVWESFPAMLRRSECGRVCTCVCPIWLRKLWFSWAYKFDIDNPVHLAMSSATAFPILSLRYACFCQSVFSSSHS